MGLRHIDYFAYTALVLSLVFLAYVFIEVYPVGEDKFSSYDMLADKYEYTTHLEYYTISPINKAPVSEFAARLETSEKVDVYFTKHSNCKSRQLSEAFRDREDILLKADKELVDASKLCIMIHNEHKEEIEIELYVYPLDLVNDLSSQ